MRTEEIIAAMKQMIEAFEGKSRMLESAKSHFRRLDKEGKIDKTTADCLHLDGLLERRGGGGG